MRRSSLRKREPCVAGTRRTICKHLTGTPILELDEMPALNRMRSARWLLQKRWMSLAVVSALAAVVLAVFWKVPQAQFVMWDDDINIYANPNHGGLSWSRIVWMFTDTKYVMYYAPLSWLTLSIIYACCGLNPLGYHVASLLLHLANTVLVYFLILQCLNRFVLPRPCASGKIAASEPEVGLDRRW